MHRDNLFCLSLILGLTLHAHICACWGGTLGKGVENFAESVKNKLESEVGAVEHKVNNAVCKQTTNCTACVTQELVHNHTLCAFNPMTQSCNLSTSHVRSVADCSLFKALTGSFSGAGSNLKGCIKITATNYKFLATLSPLPSQTEIQPVGACTQPVSLNTPTGYGSHHLECRCGTMEGGTLLSNTKSPYGRFCGKEYIGGPGQQPCDELDKCCQIYQWCSLSPGLDHDKKCTCENSLKMCTERVIQRNNTGLCVSTMVAAGNLLQELGTNGEAKCAPALLKIPAGNVTANCMTDTGTIGHAVLDWDGNCNCTDGYQGRFCTCHRNFTCSNHGSCSIEGACKCDATYYGVACKHNWLPLFIGLLVVLVFVLGLLAIIHMYQGSRTARRYRYEPVQQEGSHNTGLYKWLNRQQPPQRVINHTLDDSGEVESILDDDFDFDEDLSLDELLADDPLPPPSAIAPLAPVKSQQSWHARPNFGTNNDNDNIGPTDDEL